MLVSSVVQLGVHTWHHAVFKVIVQGLEEGFLGEQSSCVVVFRGLVFSEKATVDKE